MIRQRALACLTVGITCTAVVGCSGSDGEPSAGPGSASASPSAPTSPPTAPPTSSPPPSPLPATSPPGQGSKGGVVLGGEELGVTRLGEPFREAVDAVSVVLGEPDADPSETVRCLEAETEVRWGELVLAAQDDRLAGWASGSPTLQTPSGVTVGTPLSELERVYGASLERFPANPDNPPTFAVDGVDVLGSLSSADAGASVTGLFTSFCSGP